VTVYNTVLHLQLQDQSAQKLAHICAFKLQSRTKQFCYCNGESSEPSTADMQYLFFLVALRPNADYGLLIHEVSRSHTTTHYCQ